LLSPFIGANADFDASFLGIFLIMGNSPDVTGRALVHSFYTSRSWIEGQAVRQLEQVASLPGVKAVAAMPDLHPGKYGPVGCAILADQIHPQLVGSDIGCGMGLFALDVPIRKLRLDKTADRLKGLEGPWDGSAVDALAEADLSSTAFDASLGTIGGGNHFCELQAIEDIIEPDIAAGAGLDPAQTYALVHSGSRGLGYKILERQLAQGCAPLDPGSDAGETYFASHDEAVQWAALNRKVIAERAAQAVRGAPRLLVDLPHNLAERCGDSVVHRKGAAPSDRGLVPIPGSRGTLSYLVEPLAASSPKSLASLAHGAGRQYDRTSMHGREGRKKSDLLRLARNPFGGVVVCDDRDLLIEESPDAYKNIAHVIADLTEFGLARVVATFRPLITFKKARSELAPERAKRHREGRR
jgi:release factor H-coupled RctB family protein